MLPPATGSRKPDLRQPHREKGEANEGEPETNCYSSASLDCRSGRVLGVVSDLQVGYSGPSSGALTGNSSRDPAGAGRPRDGCGDSVPLPQDSYHRQLRAADHFRSGGPRSSAAWAMELRDPSGLRRRGSGRNDTLAPPQLDMRHFARSRSTGTRILCWTWVAVVPRNKSARKRCPWVLMATRSQPFCWTHLMISLTGSPNASSASAGIPNA